ncbi:MAG TPA: DUF4325 domain-containing protein [Thermoplasmata archaeon]|nr:DUF4325 domain-containing protein [Thermoplasmata archaeon]
MREEVGVLLMFRSSATPFFRKVARLHAATVFVDFSGIEFMSRSFADEYLAAKALSRKRLVERNLSTKVARMLKTVSKRTRISRSPPFAPRVLPPLRVGPVTTL